MGPSSGSTWIYHRTEPKFLTPLVDKDSPPSSPLGRGLRDKAGQRLPGRDEEESRKPEKLLGFRDASGGDLEPLWLNHFRTSIPHRPRRHGREPGPRYRRPRLPNLGLQPDHRKDDKFVSGEPRTPGGLVGTTTLEEFVASLAQPRKIVILVQAGKGTDAVIDSLEPLLAQGDIVIDGGNSLWTDTIRRKRRTRTRACASSAPVSPAARGRPFGPATDAGRRLRFLATPQAHLGCRRRQGRRHDRQAPRTARARATRRRRRALHRLHRRQRRGPLRQDGPQRHRIRRHADDLRGLRPDERPAGTQARRDRRVFTEWNHGILDSFLIEITADILKQKDPSRRIPLSTSSSTPPARKAPASGRRPRV